MTRPLAPSTGHFSRSDLAAARMASVIAWLALRSRQRPERWDLDEPAFSAGRSAGAATAPTKHGRPGDRAIGGPRMSPQIR